MRNFTVLCVSWIRGFYRKSFLYVFLVVFLAAVYCGYSGAGAYREAAAGAGDFKDNEASIAGNMLNYTEVSKYGFSVLSVPPPVSLFFAGPPFTGDLSGHINAVALFNIFGDRGKFKMGGDSLICPRFSRLVLVLLTLWGMYMGFEPMRGREYLKFLASGCSPRPLYFSVLVSAFFSVTLNFFLFFAGSLLGAIIHGAPQFPGPSLLPYFGAALLLLLFFVVSGTLAGTIRSNTAAYVTMAALWFGLVFVIPPILDDIFGRKSSAVPSANAIYKDKQKIINDFERKVESKYGKFNKDNINTERMIIADYRNTIFPKVEALDRDRIDRIASIVNGYDRASGFIITAFYRRVEAEAGGMGYRNRLAFYGHLLQLRREFLDHWIKHVYYLPPGKVVPFVKGDISLFRAGSALPGFFAFGFLFNLFIVVLVAVVSFRRFVTYLYRPAAKTPVKTDNPAAVLKKGELKVFRLFAPNGITERFYNLLSGRAGDNGAGGNPRFTLDGVDLSENRLRLEFLYMCHPDRIPSYMRVRDIVSLGRRLQGKPVETEKEITAALPAGIRGGDTFRCLDSDRRGFVLVEALRGFRRPVYLVDTVDTGCGITLPFIFKLNDTMKEWTEAGGSVLYFTTQLEVKPENPELRRDRDFLENELWSERVTHIKSLSDDEA